MLFSEPIICQLYILYIIRDERETVETPALAFLSHFWLQLVWPALPLDFRRNTAKKGVLIKTKHFFLLGRRDTKCQPTNRQRQDTLKR